MAMTAEDLALKAALKAAELAYIAEFQPRLKAARERRGLSQQVLATYLGLKLSTYKKYENRPTSLFPIFLLPELSTILDESISYWFTGISLPRRVKPRIVTD